MQTTSAKRLSYSVESFRKVLIVDDDVDLADATADALRALGYETRVAYAFNDALEQASAFPVDIALIDIRLGREDGVELIPALRARLPKILCVLVTGQANTQSAIRGLRNGAFDYLDKPVEIELLDAALQRCSDRLALEAGKEAAEHALAESEQLLRTFIDNSDATMNLKDLDGRYLMVNETFRKLRGNGDFIGKTYRETGGGADADRQEAIERRVLETGRVQSGEEPIEYASGDKWIRQFTKFPVYSVDGDLTGVGTIGVNVAESRRAQEKLRQSEAQLRAIIDNYPSRICLADLESRILLANEAFAQEKHLPLNTVIGKTADDLENPDIAEEVRAHSKEVVELGRPVTQERQRPDSHGNPVTSSVAKFPVYGPEGSLMGIGTIATDISARRNMEEALRESEELLRSVIGSNPSPLSIIDRNHKYVIVNPAFEALFGRAATELLGTLSTSVLDKERGADVVAHERRVMETGKTSSEERALTLPDGRQIHNIVTKFPIVDAKGKVKLVGTMMTDISERKRFEEALQRSENQLRLVIDSLPIGIGYFGADERYVLANKTSANWYGTSPEEMVGKAPRKVLKSAHPVFRDHVRRTLKGEAVTFETHAVYPDGIARDLLVTNVPDFGPNGEVRGFFGMAQDISERKRAERNSREIEERFQAVINNSPALIMLKDLEGHYLMVNDTFKKWFSLDPDCDIAETTVHDLFHEELAHDIVTHENRVIESGVPLIREIEAAYPDGVTRRVLAHKFPIFNPEGKCTALGTVNLDITEHRSLQAQLAQVQKMEAIGQMTGGVAHDFNNLLGVVIGNLDFLSEALEGNAELLELVEPATKAALSGAHLVRQLLAFSRKQPLLPKVIDLNDHVSGMMEMLQRTLGGTIKIKTDLSAGPRTVRVDPGQLGSALLNLAVNARDAMPDGGTLSIRTATVLLGEEDVERLPEVVAGDYAVVTVTDTGTGMEPDVIRQAFDPFFTTKEIGAGSGLGLSMVFGFTKQSGGHVEIESDVGEGTRVRLYLPHTGQNPEDLSETADNPPRSRGERVLVVEDDPAILSLTLKQVRSLGYEAVAAHNGAEALDVLAGDSAFDLILTDMIMPGGLNGRAFATQACDMHPGIKVVYMSGYVAGAAKRTGSDDLNAPLLRKPFRKAALAQTLRQAFDAPNSA